MKPKFSIQSITFLGGKIMMSKNILTALKASERMELYYTAHPTSPSAIRRPQLSIRSGVWVALLGESVRKGIAGFGATVEAALRAFDAQYFNNLRERVARSANLESRSDQRGAAIFRCRPVPEVNKLHYP